MKVGILLTPGTGAPAVARLAEDAGFSSAWFVDSPGLFGDLFPSMAVAASVTERISLATGVTNPVLRSAPIVASTMASLNAFAPGRIVLGIGTGFTATGVLGLPSAKLGELERFVREVRGLLDGAETVVNGNGFDDVVVQFVNQGAPWINLEDPIPVCVASAGPRALRLAGRIADQVLLGGMTEPAIIRACLAEFERGRREQGRSDAAGDVVVTPSVWLSDRDIDPEDRDDLLELRRTIGPKSLAPATTFSTIASQSPTVPRSLSDAMVAVRSAYRPPDDEGDPRTAHLRMYRGYMTELRPDQEPLVTPPVLRATGLFGSPGQVVQRLLEMRDAGVSHAVLSPLPQHVQATIEAFGAEVLPRLNQRLAALGTTA